jgi:glutathione S-transferase
MHSARRDVGVADEPARLAFKVHAPRPSTGSRRSGRLLQRYGGPFLFGKTPTLADAMYAPVATRFVTYDVALDEACAAYCQTIMALPVMQEWIDAAKGEPDDIEELEMEF